MVKIGVRIKVERNEYSDDLWMRDDRVGVGFGGIMSMWK